MGKKESSNSLRLGSILNFYTLSFLPSAFCFELSALSFNLLLIVLERIGKPQGK
jgi:hypothetical protein